MNRKELFMKKRKIATILLAACLLLGNTEGVGWQEKETKAESQVHSALKSTYYEAFCDARKALNSEQRTGSMNENIMSQGNFDMKA